MQVTGLTGEATTCCQSSCAWTLLRAFAKVMRSLSSWFTTNLWLAGRAARQRGHSGLILRASEMQQRQAL